MTVAPALLLRSPEGRLAGPQLTVQSQGPLAAGTGGQSLGGRGGACTVSLKTLLCQSLLSAFSAAKTGKCVGVENSTRNPLFLRRASRRGRDLPAFAAISATPKNALQAQSGSLECSL